MGTLGEGGGGGERYSQEQSILVINTSFIMCNRKLFLRKIGHKYSYLNNETNNGLWLFQYKEDKYIY